MSSLLMPSSLAIAVASRRVWLVPPRKNGSRYSSNPTSRSARPTAMLSRWPAWVMISLARAIPVASVVVSTSCGIIAKASFENRAGDWDWDWDWEWDWDGG